MQALRICQATARWGFSPHRSNRCYRLHNKPGPSPVNLGLAAVAVWSFSALLPVLLVGIAHRIITSWQKLEQEMDDWMKIAVCNSSLLDDASQQPQVPTRTVAILVANRELPAARRFLLSGEFR